VTSVVTVNIVFSKILLVSRNSGDWNREFPEVSLSGTTDGRYFPLSRWRLIAFKHNQHLRNHLIVSTVADAYDGASMSASIADAAMASCFQAGSEIGIPNLAGYHIIGDETAKFLAPLIRAKRGNP